MKTTIAAGMAAFVGSVSLLGLAACSSSEGLKTAEPVRVFSGPASPDAAADCILNEMTAADPNNTIRRHKSVDGIRLWADLGTGGTVGHYDIQIRPAATGSRAELRASHNMWGTSNEPADTSRVIQQCLVG